MIYTTLELCKEKSACASGYKILKKSLGKDHKNTDLIPLTHVIESNGLADALWALRATTEPQRDFITDFSVWCAEQVLDIYENKYPDDRRARDYLEGVRSYQLSEITKEDLIILRRTTTTDVATAAYDAAIAAGVAAVVAVGVAAVACANVRESQKKKLIEMLEDHKEKT